MNVNGVYIPDLIAADVMGSLYQGRAIPNVKKVNATDDTPPASTPPAATPPVEQVKNDPTTTILWVGALTSVGGLGIQFADYMSKKKR
jgi:hypothetical protein